MTYIESPPYPPKRREPKPKAFVYADEHGDGAYIVCYITVSGYVFAVFDADDLDIARACYPSWEARRGNYRIVRSATAAERAAGRGSQVYAHQLVLERALGRPLDIRGSAGEVVAHINSSTLDNRRSNLRALSHRLNVALKPDVKSGLRLPGASYDASRAARGGRGTWRARWCEPGQPPKLLGWFRTELEAHLAWRARFDAIEPGALDTAMASHPLLLKRVAQLSADARLTSAETLLG